MAATVHIPSSFCCTQRNKNPATAGGVSCLALFMSSDMQEGAALILLENFDKDIPVVHSTFRKTV
ncbi:MAG: hypothetical protein KFH87_08185, partial [Bacteroidetes bacterium]|nr:hypothetical protein [Bacteroidota bacterium]